MKTLKEFVELFAEQFDALPEEEISASTVFHDLDEYSSLTALSIISMIDEEFEVTIKGDDLKKAVTVEDLKNTVKSKLQ